MNECLNSHSLTPFRVTPTQTETKCSVVNPIELNDPGQVYVDVTSTQTQNTKCNRHREPRTGHRRSIPIKPEEPVLSESHEFLDRKEFSVFSL